MTDYVDQEPWVLYDYRTEQTQRILTQGANGKLLGLSTDELCLHIDMFNTVEGYMQESCS